MIRILYFDIMFCCLFSQLVMGDDVLKCEYKIERDMPTISCGGPVRSKPMNINQLLKDTARKNNVEPPAIRQVTFDTGHSDGFETSGNEFDDFPNLEEITLRTFASQSSILHPNTFASLPKLKDLWLKGFDLLSDPDSPPLEPLYKSLTKLGVTDSNVGQRPDIFRKFQNLVYVSLLGCPITALPPDAFEKSADKIKTLYLDSAKISKIRSSTFSDYYNLRLLVLENNKISYIENGAFDNLRNLEIVDLRNNKLTNLQEGLFKRHTKLCRLDLKGNPSAQVVNQSFEKPGCWYDSSSALRTSATFMFIVTLVGLVCFMF